MATDAPDDRGVGSPASRPNRDAGIKAASGSWPATRRSSRADSSCKASHCEFKVAVTAASWIAGRWMGEIRGLVVQGGEQPFALEPLSVLGKGDFCPLAKERTGQFQCERQSAEHLADCPGIRVLRVVRVQDRLTVGMSEKQPQRRLPRQDRHLDRGEPAQVATSGGEEDPAGQGRHEAARSHWPAQQGRLAEIVQDKEDLRGPT